MHVTRITITYPDDGNPKIKVKHAKPEKSE